MTILTRNKKMRYKKVAFLTAFVFLTMALLPLFTSAQNTNTPLIDEPEDVITAAEAFVVWMYRVFWVVAVGFVIWAAFLFLSAGGDAEKVTKAKKMLLYAVIAAAIVLLANGIDVIVTNLLKPS
jgi:uncharacterized membrane protein